MLLKGRFIMANKLEELLASINWLDADESIEPSVLEEIQDELNRIAPDYAVFKANDELADSVLGLISTGPEELGVVAVMADDEKDRVFAVFRECTEANFKTKSTWASVKEKPKVFNRLRAAMRWLTGDTHSDRSSGRNEKRGGNRKR